MIGPNELGFLDALAAKTPTPAGGAAAAYAGAMAASLVILVARVTIGKQKNVRLDRKLEKIIAEMEECRAQLVEAVDRDSAAFMALLAARRLPPGHERDVTLLEAIRAAVDVPFETAEVAVRVLKAAVVVIEQGNLNALNDAICAGYLAGHAANVSILNMLANHDDDLDSSRSELLDSKHKALGRRMRRTLEQMEELYLSRLGVF